MKGRGGKLRIPNPHTEDIGRGLLVRILRQAGIEREEWEAL
jgi:predicted RNA binding protein YcfA (HicA-like mRNA interferase family)